MTPEIENVPRNKQHQAKCEAELSWGGNVGGWIICHRAPGVTLVSPDGKRMVKFWMPNGANEAREWVKGNEI